MLSESLKVGDYLPPLSIPLQYSYETFYIGKIGSLSVSYIPLFAKIVVSDYEHKRNTIPKPSACHLPSTTDEKFSYFGIFPTSECNLRCIYCYAKGGDVSRTINFEFVKRGVEFMNNNSTEKLEVVFHGGGEPTTKFRLLKKIKEYVDKNLKAEKTFTLQTNGVFSNEVREWVSKNINHVSLSCDGPPYIQDSQRPLKNGGRSSPIVESTIQYFVEKSVDMKVGAVISKFSNEREEEILRYFHQLGVTKVRFSPLFERGRCLCDTEYSTKPEMLNSFPKNLLKSVELADLLGISLIYHGYINSYRNVTCGVAGRSFLLTSDGFVSPCLSVPLGDSEYNDLIFGFFDENKNEIKIDGKKLDYLRRRTVQNIPACQTCFMKWHCAGGCALAACLSHGRDIYSPHRNYCKRIRKIARGLLLYKVERELLKIKPYIEERDGFVFKGILNKFQLKEFPAEWSDGIMLNVDVNKDMDSVLDQVTKIKPRILLLSFKLSAKNLNTQTGRGVEGFLRDLKERHICFRVMKPLPMCLFRWDYDRVVREFKIPKGCGECMWLYVMKDGYFHICNTKIKVPENKVKTRKEIVELFKKYGKTRKDSCKRCIYLMRGNCNGLCQRCFDGKKT